MSYLGNGAQYDVTINKKEYIATAGQTLFPVVFDSYVEVYLNGVRLSEADFTKNSNVSITLGTGATAGDVVQVCGYQNYQYADASTMSNTPSGGISATTVQGAINELDSEKVPKVASTDNAIVRFNGATGDVQNSGAYIDDSGNVGIGTSSLNSYTNYTTVTQNGINGVEYDFNVGGNLAGYIELAPTLFKLNAEGFRYFQFTTNGAERMRIDTSGNVGIGTSSPATNLGKALHIYNSTNDGTPNSNSSLKLESVNRNSAILLYGNVNTITSFKPDGTSSGTLVMQSSTSTQLFTNSNGLGYGGGSGGTVTQLTSKGTPVTLNKPTGTIIMNDSPLAQGASVMFGVSNSIVTASDNIIVSHQSGGAGTGTYEVGVDSIANGAYGIYVKNTGGGSLSENIVINFTIIKGSAN